MKIDVRGNRIKRFGIAIGLLSLFLFYYSNVSFFTHTHIVNGVTIVHSHLHGESHDTSNRGDHSSSELTLMFYLSHFDAPLSIFYTLESCLYSLQLSFVFVDLTSHIQRGCFAYSSSRAPPCSPFVDLFPREF